MVASAGCGAGRSGRAGRTGRTSQTGRTGPTGRTVAPAPTLHPLPAALRGAGPLRLPRRGARRPGSSRPAGRLLRPRRLGKPWLHRRKVGGGWLGFRILPEASEPPGGFGSGTARPHRAYGGRSFIYHYLRQDSQRTVGSEPGRASAAAAGDKQRARLEDPVKHPHCPPARSGPREAREGRPAAGHGLPPF